MIHTFNFQTEGKSYELRLDDRWESMYVMFAQCADKNAGYKYDWDRWGFLIDLTGGVPHINWKIFDTGTKMYLAPQSAKNIVDNIVARVYKLRMFA